MEMAICKKCGRDWPDDSEQAACIRVYSQCIVCCVNAEKEKNYQWDIAEVIENRREFISR